MGEARLAGRGCHRSRGGRRRGQGVRLVRRRVNARVYAVAGAVHVVAAGMLAAAERTGTPFMVAENLRG